MNKKHQILHHLGLKNFTNNLFKAAASNGKELLKNPLLKLGQFKDCVYFIFVNNELVKIGKVGGGKRCLYNRVSDYRSWDRIASNIRREIRNRKEIQILSLNFPSVVEEHFGVKTEGSTKGPNLEKALIENALELGYSLPWNKYKG
jgi:hypothetical protein